MSVKKSATRSHFEIYLPRTEGSYTVHNGEGGETQIQYQRTGNRLVVDAGIAVGQIEIVLFNVQAETALLDEREMNVEQAGKSQRVRFDGRARHQIVFVLQ